MSELILVGTSIVVQSHRCLPVRTILEFHNGYRFEGDCWTSERRGGESEILDMQQQDDRYLGNVTGYRAKDCIAPISTNLFSLNVVGSPKT